MRRTLDIDGLDGLGRPAAAVEGSAVERRLREERGAFETTWRLLEAADRTEALAAGARTEATRAADAERAYLFLADRLRLLASSVPDGDWDDATRGLSDRSR